MENLVQESKLGNTDACSELFTSVREDLMKVARKYLKTEDDCDDAVQNASEIAIKRLYKLRNNKYFKTWITRILINECKKFYNSKNKTIIEVPLDEVLCEYECFDVIDSNINFERLIGNLKTDEKKIYTLFHKYNYTIKEISLALGINEGTIKSKLSRGKSKIKKNITFILFAFIFVTASVVVASCFINYIKELFSTHDIGKDNDGVLMAIENLEWFQKVDMDYVDLGDGYKIKVEYLVMDEMNLYLIFDFVSDKDIGKFNELSITDLKITNENGEVICDMHNKLAEQYSIHVGNRLIENNNHHMKSLIYMYTNKFPISNSLTINFSKVALSKKLENIKITSKNINININLDEKFINRHSIYYTCQANTKISKTLITETGFYAIIQDYNCNKLNSIKLIDEENNVHTCYYISVNSSDTTNYQYIIVSQFNDTTMENLKLLIDDEEYNLKKQK